MSVVSPIDFTEMKPDLVAAWRRRQTTPLLPACSYCGSAIRAFVEGDEARMDCQNPACSAKWSEYMVLQTPAELQIDDTTLGLS